MILAILEFSNVLKLDDLKLVQAQSHNKYKAKTAKRDKYNIKCAVYIFSNELEF